MASTRFSILVLLCVTLHLTLASDFNVLNFRNDPSGTGPAHNPLSRWRRDVKAACGGHEWRCADDMCIPASLRCDGHGNCWDDSDEEGCPTACGGHEWRCADDMCIPASLRCDGRGNCLDGSDEEGCPSHCAPDEFGCSNGRCIRQIFACDLDDDCGDASEEASCGKSKPGDPCPPRYFSCLDGRSCIARSQQCNGDRECDDGSDELGCAAPRISQPPPIKKASPPYSTFEITCKATGVPPPVIVWRFNNTHLPAKCIHTNKDGLSTLRCSNIGRSHQGTYSCEAQNNQGEAVATPNTLLAVRENPLICFPPTFNDGAASLAECIPCFCFGASKTCVSSRRLKAQLPLPKTEKLRAVKKSFPFPKTPTAAGAPSVSDYYYYSLPPRFLGDQLTSYGGALSYEVLSAAPSPPSLLPDAAIMSKGVTLIHYSASGYGLAVRQQRTVPLEPSAWFLAGKTRKMATRENMMVVLQAMDSFHIRAPPHASGAGMAQVDQLLLDTASHVDAASAVALRAVAVEECTCPPGYSGASCESCKAGFQRLASQRHPYGQCIPK